MITPEILASQLAHSPAALRVALARLARGADDHAHALSLLLLLRAAAERDGSVVELTSHDGGVLATIEHASSRTWIGDLCPISFATVQAVLAELPDLASSFAAWCAPDGIVLRTLGSGPPIPPPPVSQRATPAELPSLQLLLEAGLFKNGFDEL